MASFRMNIARIRDCPPPQEVLEAMEEFGLPDDEEFGVLNASATDQVVFATLLRRTQQAVQRLDRETREVVSVAVDKVTVLPFVINPRRDALETYAGSATAFEQIGAFLSGDLALPVIVDVIELDVASAVEKLAKGTQRFQLRSIRVSEYAHNSYMSGPYAPKFLDTEQGREFLSEYAEFVTAARVRFQAPTGRATASLSPKACFSYSCNEDDQHHVQAVLRKLL